MLIQKRQRILVFLSAADFNCSAKKWLSWILHPRYARPSLFSVICKDQLLLRQYFCCLAISMLGSVDAVNGGPCYVRPSLSETRSLPGVRNSTVYATVSTFTTTSYLRRTAPSGDGWSSCPLGCWGRRWVVMTTTLLVTSYDDLVASWHSCVDKMLTRPLFIRLHSLLHQSPWVTLNNLEQPYVFTSSILNRMTMIGLTIKWISFQICLVLRIWDWLLSFKPLYSWPPMSDLEWPFAFKMVVFNAFGVATTLLELVQLRSSKAALYAYCFFGFYFQ